MSRPVLARKRILVVEDEYLIAFELREKLRQLGADVVGPVPNIADALALLEEVTIDVALLDVRLRDETVLPLAEVLEERGIPFVLATGCDAEDLPPPLQRKPNVGKLVDLSQLIEALSQIAT